MSPRVSSDEAPPGLQVFRMDIAGLVLALLVYEVPAEAQFPPLTAAEHAVLSSILDGLTNAQIAARRGTSPRTVANQVATLFRKLGVRSRSELAARHRTRR